jgi:hypothetical protein
MMGVISVVGLGLVGYSRYEVQHPSTTTTTTTTTLPSAYYAALAFDICGKVSTLPVSTNTKASVISVGNGVLSWSPKTVHNPTLAQFVTSFQPKTVLASSELQLPGKKAKLYKSGDLCGSAPGTLQIETWSTVSAPTGTVTTGGPGAVKLVNGQMITVAFVPAGTAIARPAKATQQELLFEIESAAQASSTTTSLPLTSLPSTSTTVKGGTTTTVKGATTTTTAGHPTTTSGPTTTSTPGATTTTAPAH